MAEPRPVATAYVRLVLLGAAVGIPAALATALLLALVDDVEHWLWTDLPRRLGHAAPPWYLVLGLPVAGAVVVAGVRLLLPGDGGNRPLLGLAGPPEPIGAGPGIVLAAVGTLSFGAVLGPEAPVIAVGAIVALVLTRAARLEQGERRALGLAGSIAAVSSLFGGPLVGAMLMLEGGIAAGAALIPMLLPGFVAAAVGYVVFVGFGSWGGIGAQPISVPGLPAYRGTHLLDLLVGVAVGIVAAAVVVLVRRIATRVERDGRPRLGLVPLLLAGGLAVGALAEAADLLGAHATDVLFSGQSSVAPLVAESSAKVVAVLLVAKGVAYAVSLGCGFRGGPVFPAIFLGVGLATFAVLALDVSPTLAVAVGAAAGMAAMTRLLIAPVLFAALLVGHAGLDAVPAAVLAASAAWIATAAFDRYEATARAPATR